MEKILDNLLSNARGQLSASTSWPERYKELSVMCLYEDDATQKRASATCATVVNGTPVARRTAWKLADLREPGVLAGAVHTAMRADVIVVSLTRGHGLPLPFYVWVNAWLPYRNISGGRLVVLVGQADTSSHAEHVVQYLKQAASQANMDFEAHLVSRSKPRLVQPEFQARQDSLQLSRH